MVVCRLDRLGRSLPDLLNLIEDLARRDVGLRSLVEQIDTTSATGRLVLHVFGALAEFERALMRERTMAGLNAARSRGRVGGRPRALTTTQLAHAKVLAATGTPVRVRLLKSSAQGGPRCIAIRTLRSRQRWGARRDR